MRYEKKGKRALHLKRLARNEIPPLRRLKDFRVRRFSVKNRNGELDKFNQKNKSRFYGDFLVNILEYFFLLDT